MARGGRRATIQHLLPRNITGAADDPQGRGEVSTAAENLLTKPFVIASNNKLH